VSQSGVLFVVTYDGAPLVSVVDALARAGERDASRALSIVAEDLVTAVNDEFETGGHGEWDPLKEATLRKRRREGKGAQILKDNGRFAGSINPNHGPLFAEASTDVFYAVYHVSDQPRRIIPLRNPFDIPEEIFEEACVTILQEMRLS
jgi:phage gpG-like protein